MADVIRVIVLNQERGGEGEFQLEDDEHFDTIIGEVTIPAGFITDFASIPRIARWLLPQTGHSARAALLHDWLLERGETLAIRRSATRVFNDELKKAGSGVVRRWIMVAAVAVFTFPTLYLLKEDKDPTPGLA